MKKKNYLTLSFILILSLSLVSCYPTFEEYVSDYQKVYNQTEWIFRKSIYESKIAIFATIN